ncbi:MAG TPA: S8 family serine peptidase [Acidimicrobiia bacterium]|nr:S8 family serine peptidase [Acidimicrobiia bacterium]
MGLLTLPATAAPVVDEYIVVLRPTDRPVRDVADDIASAHQGEIGFVYTTALQGFTIEIPQQAAGALARNPNVAYIEPVVEVAAAGTQPIPTGVDRIDADLNPVVETMDVDIAILDTGVYLGLTSGGQARSHLDLNLRYVSDCTGAVLYPWFGGCSGSGDFQDYHGHGTHVAGIAAAYDNDIGSIGVAPGAVLHSFKVLGADGTGTSGMILAGIDAVASRADLIEVANMSLGFRGTSQAIDDAIAAATDAGVIFVVAAGNDGIPASEFSPANAPDALAVSALADFDGLPGAVGSPTCRADQDDTLADFSNYGPTVDIAAPGVCIFSTHLDDGYTTYSGTSMASPFVAGAIARYIAENDLPTDDRADVNAIKAAVLGAAVPQSSACGFQDVDSSPEPLLFVNGPLYGGDGSCGSGSPIQYPPTADFSFDCADLVCTFMNESTDADGDIISSAWDFGDSTTSIEQSPSHEYVSPGTYTVTLTVVDDDGSSNSTSQEVTVSDQPPVNNQPSAGFTSSCTDLECVFTSSSSDPDGDILTHSWVFGDGNGSSASSPTHTYAAGGAYTVELTVSDGELTDTTSLVVNVSEPEQATEIGGTVNPIISSGRDAEVAIAVYDNLGDYVGGATVEGYFSYLDNRGRARTATASGVSESEDIGYGGFLANTLIVKRLPPNSTVTGFCITDITAVGYTFVTTGFECWPWSS